MEGFSRRVATPEAVVYRKIKRRSATREYLGLAPPWAEAHGYRHQVAPRLQETEMRPAPLIGASCHRLLRMRGQPTPSGSFLRRRSRWRSFRFTGG